MKKVLKFSILILIMFLFTACNKEKYELEELVTFNLNKKYNVEIDEAEIATITQEDKDFIVEISVCNFAEDENIAKRRTQYNKINPLGLSKYELAGKEGLMINTTKNILLEVEINNKQYLEVLIKSSRGKDLVSILEQKEVQTIIKSIKIK